MGKQMTTLRLIALAIILLVGNIVAVYGQTPSPLPPGMTQDQFDAMVDAISKSVVVKLKSEGVPATPVPAAAPSQPGVASNVVADELAAFLEKTERVPRAVPTLGAYLASIPRLLDEGEHGGRGALSISASAGTRGWSLLSRRNWSCANRSVISVIGSRRVPHQNEGSHRWSILGFWRCSKALACLPPGS